MVTSETPPLVLNGSAAVVTGGGRGLGRVLARALASAGARVGLVARSADQLAESVRLIEADGGVAVAAVGDLADPGAAENAMRSVREELGPVDLLVNNAGVTGPIGTAWEVPEQDWWRAVEVNLRTVTVCSRLALPDMVARRRGRIVNITSRAGIYRWPLLSAYSVSKAAVVKYTENLAQETRRHGISVFSVHPGILPIGFGEQALAAIEQGDGPHGGLREWFRGEFAAGRSAEPQQAAELIVRIAAGDADRLSGRHLTVHDDLDKILAGVEDVRSEDLYLLRLNALPPE